MFVKLIFQQILLFLYMHDKEEGESETDSNSLSSKALRNSEEKLLNKSKHCSFLG